MRRKHDPQDELSQQDIELIRSRLRQLDDPIKLPYVLRPENLRERITKEDRRRFREAAYGDFRTWQRLAATAAAVVLVVTAYVGISHNTGLNLLSTKNTGEAAPMAPQEAAYSSADIYHDEAVPQTQLYAQNYHQIYAELGRMLESPAIPSTNNQSSPAAEYEPEMDGNDGGVTIFLAPPTAEEPNEKAGGMSIDSQEMARPKMSGLVAPAAVNRWAEWEKADIAATDGSYLYYYRPSNYLLPQNTVYIIEAKSMNITSRIELESNDGVALQLAGDKLALIVRQLASSGDSEPLYSTGVQRSLSQFENGQSGDRLREHSPDSGTTTLLVYDISDPKTPALQRRFEQDGSYAASMISGSVLYMASVKNLRPNVVETGDPLLCELVPVVRDSAVGYSQAVPAGDIVVTSGSAAASYTVVSAADLSAPEAPAVTKAVLGGDGLYMSPHNLYVYYHTYAQDGQTPTTSLVRMAMRDGGVEVRAQGQIEGRLSGPLSLGERDGTLRAATTSLNPDTGVPGNNIYLLNSKLEPIGSMEGLAPGEVVTSARYVGETAYIVTQNPTEPVFAVDISDQSSPQIIGQLELPSMAQNLISLGNQSFAGLEENIYMNDAGEVVSSGLRLSLYDLSSPGNPQQRSALVLPGTESHTQAMQNPKATLYLPEQRLLGLPLTARTASGKLLLWGYTLIKLDESGQGASLLGTVSHADRLDDSYITSHFQSVERGLNIGDMLYTFSNSKVVASSLSDLKQSGVLELN